MAEERPNECGVLLKPRTLKVCNEPRWDPYLGQSPSRSVLLADEDYRGIDFLDWLYEEVQVLRIMPSDRPYGDEDQSTICRGSQQAESSFS